MQKYTREERVNHDGESCEEFIQFRLYRVINDKDIEAAKNSGTRLYASQLERCGTSGPYINSREVTKRFRVIPGTYLIIPSCYESGKKRDFLLRLYTETTINQNGITVLEDHKPDLLEEDIFFGIPKSIDDAFSSWANLLGGDTGNKKIKSGEIRSMSQFSSQDNLRTRAAGIRGNGSQAAFVSNYQIYRHDDSDIFGKIDINDKPRFRI